MLIHKTTPNEMLSNPEIKDMLPSLSAEEFPVEEMIKCISTMDVYRVGDIGFLIIRDSHITGCKECHAYFFPSQRNKSIKGLKAIVDFVKHQGYNVYTTVTGDFPHVLRLLKMIGFSVIEVEENALTKGGVKYPLFHLTNNV